MSENKALAINYRPTSFDDVVEQASIKAILQNQLATKTFKNCYLFTGGAGTGKTTLARIFAREINEGMGMPIEIDAASNNGVDNVREIIENAKKKALDSKFKVYILDEVHMLSTGAWNAMLKLIEEPPALTIFIFCTTDPQKIPNTILSRVQRYDFQRISYEAIKQRLVYIIEQENKLICEMRGNEFLPGDEELLIQIDNEALSYIAKIADGGMRDAITMLDKCISYSKQLSIENVINSLGVANYDVMLELTNILINKQTCKTYELIDRLYKQGIDLKKFLKLYINFLVDSLKYIILPDFELIQIPAIYETQLDSFIEHEIRIKTYLKELLKLHNDIKWEANPKTLIEICLIFLSEAI